MAIRLLTILFFLTASAATAMNRTAYVDEAKTEIQFYFQFLNQLPSFKKSLTEVEAKQFDLLLKVNEKIGAQGGLKIRFSEKAEDFILNPGEPERSAKTTDRLEDAIYFNLRKLNDAETKISYLDIIQLLVHELGHKLAADKIQTAVDSLASKIVKGLSAYSKIETLWFSKSEHRLLREYYETLALPKSTTSLNVEPSAFFVTDWGPHKLSFWLKNKLPKNDAGTFIQVNQVFGYLLNGYQTEVKYSIYRSVATMQGQQLVLENSYKLNTNILIDRNSFTGMDTLYDKNFDVEFPVWLRNFLNFDFQVTKVEEVERNQKFIKWDIHFTGKLNPAKIYLLVGADDQNSPHGCQLVSSSAEESVARCTYRIPKVTCISIIDVLQIMVDGDVADLPEIIEIDLERMNARYTLADVRPLKFNKVVESGITFYDFTIKSEFPYTSLIVRCREQKNFGGLADAIYHPITEQVFLEGALPVRSQSGTETVFRVSCLTQQGVFEQIVVTDETGYPLIPKIR